MGESWDTNNNTRYPSPTLESFEYLADKTARYLLTAHNALWHEGQQSSFSTSLLPFSARSPRFDDTISSLPAARLESSFLPSALRYPKEGCLNDV